MASEEVSKGRIHPFKTSRAIHVGHVDVQQINYFLNFKPAASGNKSLYPDTDTTICGRKNQKQRKQKLASPASLTPGLLRSMHVSGAHIGGRIWTLADQTPLIKLIVRLVVRLGARGTATRPATCALVKVRVLVGACEAHL